MARVFKRVAIGLGVVAVLLLALVMYLTLVFDPNVLKPELERLAREQGIDLRMPGNVSWQWFPQLGLILEQVQVGEEPIVSIGKFSAQVALRPLLQGQLVVEALDLVDLQLNLQRNAAGVGNWESLVQSSSAEPAAATEPTAADPEAELAVMKDSQALVLAVQRLRIKNAALDFRDEQQDTLLQARELDIEIDDLNLTGKNFQLRQMGKLSFNESPQLTLHTAAELAVEQGGERLRINNLDVQLRDDAQLVKVGVDGEVNLQQQQPNLAIKVSEFDLKHWLQMLQIELPEMAAADALARVGLEVRVSGAEGNWQVDGLALQLDESQITGVIGAEGDGPLHAGLEIDTLNLDRYLPAPAETAPAAPAVASAPLPETPLDFAGLQTAHARVSLSIAKLQVKNLLFTDAQVALAARSGQLHLSDLSAGFYQGHIAVKGSLDARETQPRAQLEGQITGVELKPVLEVLAREQRVTGAINSDFNGTTSGASLAAWQRNLQASLNMTANSLSLAEVDIERSACELAALVNREPSPELAWKGATQLRDVSLKAAVEGQQVNLKSLQAGVENLGVAAKGKLNYSTGKFEFPLDIMFLGEVDATRKCQVRERWRNKLLPLRCKGELAELSAKTCLPDHKRLDDLLRGELKDRGQQKLKTKLEEKLGTDKGQAVDELLREILNK